jgi:hypothetical protein
LSASSGCHPVILSKYLCAQEYDGEMIVKHTFGSSSEDFGECLRFTVGEHIDHDMIKHISYDCYVALSKRWECERAQNCLSAHVSRCFSKLPDDMRHRACADRVHFGPAMPQWKRIAGGYVSSVLSKYPKPHAHYADRNESHHKYPTPMFRTADLINYGMFQFLQSESLLATPEIDAPGAKSAHLHAENFAKSNSKFLCDLLKSGGSVSDSQSEYKIQDETGLFYAIYDFAKYRCNVRPPIKHRRYALENDQKERKNTSFGIPGLIVDEHNIFHMAVSSFVVCLFKHKDLDLVDGVQSLNLGADM